MFFYYYYFVGLSNTSGNNVTLFVSSVWFGTRSQALQEEVATPRSTWTAAYLTMFVVMLHRAVFFHVALKGKSKFVLMDDNHKISGRKRGAIEVTTRCRSNLK